MSRIEALQQYQRALKQGQKAHRAAVMRGEYPYPQVLDELLNNDMSLSSMDMGLIEIPLDKIVGTKTAGRRSAFAANFMPLLEEDTEFADKWIQLCRAHLGDEGIREPIRCYEYLGRFYVQEGNKRVSVLRSYEASTIPGFVTRLLPPYSDDPEIQRYYEFMAFYQLAGLYQIQFSHSGSYAKLQAALGYDADHVWTQEEKRVFLSRYSLFCNVFGKLGGKDLDITAADALLVWLRVYPYTDLRDLTTSALTKSLQRVWPDLKLMTRNAPLAINTEPIQSEKSLLGHLFGSKPNHLNVAFLFYASPMISAFTRSHELGSQRVEQTMGDKVTVMRVYDVRSDESGYQAMVKAVEAGANVIIATAPPLIGNCRKLAAHYPDVKILNCALSMPYAGVRTYYSRIYEAKFITGALSAAVSRADRIGYVADYPILGAAAGINAFAMGARMINPDIKVQLEWSCVPGYPYEAFAKNGVRAITNREVPSPDVTQWSWDWGTYFLREGGEPLPIASPCWNWGKFYEQVLTSILSGAWDDLGGRDSAVSYWWGMDSGVTDVEISPDLPDGVRRLAQFLRQGIINGQISPFGFQMVDQNGVLRTDGDTWPTLDQIMNMDWLCDCVEGSIPEFDQLKPVSQAVVRVLGIYRDRIPPEKEGVIL